MELAGLSGSAVLRSTDVSMAREAARQRRLRRLATVLALVAVVVVGRSVYGAVEYLTGNWRAASGAFSWHLVPHLPAGSARYLPAALLIVVLLAVLVVPLLGAGRSPHVVYRPEELGITFADVVGAPTVVEEAVKTLNLFLAHRTFRDRMGGTPRRAVLFEGPPGTGKTHIAKAMAAEAGVPFLFVSSTAFQSHYYGMSGRKIRSFFKSLRVHARREGGAIGFIEEIDAIGASRSHRGNGGEGLAGVVNELLVQMQSFDQPPPAIRLAGALTDVANRLLPAGRRIPKPRCPPANILVIGATNRAGDLDPALLRPGRFDRTITVDLPSRDGRRQIVDYYLDRKAHEPVLDEPARRDALAAATFGYTPVMIEHVLDEALVWALRRGADRLSPEDISRAKMTEELGLAQPVAYTEAERRAIATHEAGHAVVAHLTAPWRRLEVLSVIKRKDALGLLAHTEVDERWTRSQGEVEDLIRIAMGGLAAEELYLGQTTTGVAGDLQAATAAAARMVGSFGMAGTLASLQEAGPPGAGVVATVLADDAGRQAVERILATAKGEAVALVGANRHLVDALRDALLESDELIGDQIGAVLAGAGPGTPPTRDRSRVVDLRGNQANCPNECGLTPGGDTSSGDVSSSSPVRQAATSSTDVGPHLSGECGERFVTNRHQSCW
jgi:cell division protease FtsH